MTKRTKEFKTLIEKDKAYSAGEAISLLKKAPHVKFDETVDISFVLNANPKDTSQSYRGTVVLPKGSGRKVKVAVFCKGEDAQVAEAAGADYVGGDELIEKVKKGFLDFNVAVATPEMMRELGKIGKILGPRGLMPNPKADTVTKDIARAVKEAKAGKVEFKMNKQGQIQAPVGKISFEESALYENIMAVVIAVINTFQSTSKRKPIKSVYLSTTMGPGVRLDGDSFSSDKDGIDALR